jgi:vacuolar protein sorting-associated protein 52
MWLDRFSNSGHLSPQSNSRSISPVPQRSLGNRGAFATSPRVNLSSRSSTLSLLGNDSTGSLSGAARSSNGSALKQVSTAQDGLDPTQLLATLLGLKANGVAQQTGESSNSVIVSEDLGLDFHFDGLFLEELAQGQGERKDAYLSQSLEDCMSRLFCGDC